MGLKPTSTSSKSRIELNNQTCLAHLKNMRDRDAYAGGPGGDYTPPLLGPPSLVTVGSVHYDDDRECESDLSVATNSELHEEDTEDVYGTAFAPSPPPPNEDLTSSAINRIVDRQIEKYNVNVTTGYQVRPEEQRPREIEHTQVETAKIMLDEEAEAELFPEGESLLHGGGTKAVTYRDWTFATLFLGNIGVILVLSWYFIS